MYSKATLGGAIATVLVALAIPAGAQSPNSALSSGEIPRDWRHVGNTAVDLSLAGLATGPVNRAWYSSSGSLMIQTASQRVFETADFETWKQVANAAVPADPLNLSVARLPESNMKVRNAGRGVFYALGRFVYRSEDGGVWENLSGYRNTSIIGDDLTDLAVAPSNPDEIVVTGGAGVFRSVDAGKTWSGLNQSLPNLPAVRLLNVNTVDHGVRLALARLSTSAVLWSSVEWSPGEKTAWRPANDPDLASEFTRREAFKRAMNLPISAMAVSGNSIYLGTVDGRILVSLDEGGSWQPVTNLGADAGAIERFWIDPADSRTAIAVLGSRQRDPASPLPAVHVVHTANGGGFWDNLTGNLADASVHGVAADRATGAVYVATDRGAYMTYTNLQVMGSNNLQWTRLGGLAPGDPVADVKLDADGNQLWAATQGFGVFATLAPHRARDPRVVSTADLVARATAPGSLISVLGTKVQTAHAGDLSIPVLHASDSESQLQIPFEARGDTVSLALESANGRMTMPVQLEPASPGIIVDREDGAPMLLDADTGVMLDAMNTAHPRSRIQILATGLGRTNPDWPTGLAGPAENPPQVAATVKAYLDRQPVEVTRAVLAPYVGFYLIEIEVPKIVNYGPAELYIEAGGKASNRVRVYVTP